MLNTKDKDGWNGFHFACRYGHLETSDMLGQHSAEFDIDLNAKDRDGKTGFLLACRFGHFEVVKVLIQKPTELNIDR